MRTSLSVPESQRQLNAQEPHEAKTQIFSLAPLPLFTESREDGNCYKVTAKKYSTGDVKAASFRLYPEDKEFSRGGYKRKNSSTEEMDDLTLKKSLQRSQSRAKDLVIQKQLDQLMTLTTRGNYDFETLQPVLKLFLRKMRKRYHGLNYVCVAELQKRGAVHFHFGIAGYFHFSTPHRIWNYCLNFYGLSDGNVDFSSPRTKGYRNWNGKKLGSYLGKYITKDLLTSFNKKRYWSGGDTPPIERYLGFVAIGLHVPRMLDEVIRFLTRKPAIKFYEFHERYGVCVATT